MLNIKKEAKCLAGQNELVLGRYNLEDTSESRMGSLNIQVVILKLYILLQSRF